jgi:uncharacterized membrane protein YdfJ with MMPL/SSD domain
MMRLSGRLRRHRWLVFVLWLLALVPSVALALTQSHNLTGGGFDVAGSQSLRVQYQLEDHYPQFGASPLALVAAPRADATYADMAAAVAQLEDAAKGVPSLEVVPNPVQPPPAPDRPYVVSLKLGFDNTGAVDVARQLRAKVGVRGDQPGRTENGRVKLYVIGQGALGAAAQTSTKQDIADAERWNLPIVLLVLIVVFGSLAAAAIPIALGFCTVIVTMGAVYLLSTMTTMSVFVTSTVSMFGIALAIDYSLFILMRFREELRCGRDPDQATDAAMATSGLAVVLSGLTVIASLTGIYLIGTPVLQSMATGAILAVAFAVLTSATLIPAVLSIFGRSAARRARWLHWSRRAECTRSRFWTRWVGAVMRRPWLSATAATTFLLILAAPALGMVLGNSLQRQFPSSHEIRGGVAAASEALGPGALGPVRILVNFPDADADDPRNAPVLDALARSAGQAVNIVSVSPPVFGDDNRSALLSAVLSVDPEELKARATIDRLRATLPAVPELNDAGPSRVTVDVGGPTALIKDFDDRVAHTQLLVLAFVATIAFVMLLVSVRSVVLALKGVLMTMLSVAAAYGSLVMVFQWGWLERLGFEPLGSVDSTIPPLVLAMTFGLSMDYEIFLLTRIRERYLQSNDTRDAVAYGVATSARTITSAALIMIAIFIGFAFAGMPLVAQLGVACAVAIAVDATVVRMVLVPALMAVFDRWNWWLPGWLARILPSVDFDRPLPKVDPGDVVVIPDDISALAPSPGDMRLVVRSSARLRELAPDAISVVDPLAFSGCATVNGAEPAGLAASIGSALDRRRGRSDGPRSAVLMGTKRAQLHPITMWQGRLAVALEALETEAPVRRRSPVETTNVQLPTGDRLQIPTAAETLRMQSFLVLCRNSATDFAGIADLADALGVRNAAKVLADVDGYYSAGRRQPLWIATQLVRRLADPIPTDTDEGDDWSGPDGEPRWDDVRRRCLSLAVAIMEEAS